ncbi:Tda3p KNAG_0B03320 [Huiozyma naganishii CBS 8797]|uniref:FAD dependent oxidoreductase domain-containing protein n=1 Tax=Huiozyma naganishii (strain ATCC MYA-139 / BCRC 22969 / CBS 8797 / KCTC 17520 / NBRC 10181 / NCYC 3082 / Yp74L-3) TaxID=1071383 RepID=J7S3K4_HUIN7|nr:hypothetical protein KNAG_0B03320 [Kazachstania naganishii CBS 8797]CCK68774.1 hypothetical protein KNAG_0B03320 [Kazachstania naganishii CBS 8797]
MDGKEKVTGERSVEIAIVGGGIIGCSIAYYLTKHPNFDAKRYHITIFESNNIACAASGKAGGLLASWAFPAQIGALSFNLHQLLAAEHDGAKKWDYRHLDTINLEADLRRGDSQLSLNSLLRKQREHARRLEKSKKWSKYGESSTPEGDCDDTDGGDDDGDDTLIGKNRSDLPTNLRWIDGKKVKSWSYISDSAATAQLHPYKFTKFLFGEAEMSGSVDLVYGKVTQLKMTEDRETIVGLEYEPVSKHSDPAKADEDEHVRKVHKVDKLIIAAGPWTSEILPECPVSGLRAHSIIIKPDDISKISPYALFTELQISDAETFSPEIYTRRDVVYVCGEGEAMALPDPTQDVEITQEKCDKLYKYACEVSPLLSAGKLVTKQACYLPVLDVATSSGPLMGETNVEGLYLASGHSCWGINNSLATGKIMSEIVMNGETLCANVENLDPKLYFDARV